MQLFYEFVILFFIFAVLGWMMEVTLKYIQYHRFINRGFLIGPYCPIYGAGVVGVTVLVGGLIGREGTYGETFLAGFVICGFLEYMTSLYMEKMFHARWWDYSDQRWNLGGFICLKFSLLWGAGSVVMVRLVHPLLAGPVQRLPHAGNLNPVPLPDLFPDHTAGPRAIQRPARTGCLHLLFDHIQGFLPCLLITGAEADRQHRLPLFFHSSSGNLLFI